MAERCSGDVRSMSDSDDYGDDDGGDDGDEHGMAIIMHGDGGDGDGDCVDDGSDEINAWRW